MSEKSWLAHSKNEKGVLHPLALHLKQSADIALTFCRTLQTAERADLADIVYLTSLLHDVGKYTDNFQQYLSEVIKHGKPHAHWGAKLINTLFENSKTGKMAAIAALGHHCGLKNIDDAANEMVVEDDDKKAFLDIFHTVLQDLKVDIETLLNYRRELEGLNPLKRDIITRYIFSCLTDADWLDTERHFNADRFTARINCKLEHEELIRLTESYINLLKSEQTPINKLRNDALEYALCKAREPVGFFSLNLPTGYGKTVASTLWALKHAKFNRLDRIIIVIPFINIIDQSAAILKKIYGEERVLEHHSSIIADKNDDESSFDIKKLACENWDYPIIITTSVQFFESLFSSAPSKCRKLHNIANSVVILDEVQTLPMQFAESSIEFLKYWQELFNTSFLFTSATMPAFCKRDKFNGIENITSLVKDPNELFLGSKRVEYRIINDFNPIKFPDLERAVQTASGSVLTVFNTRKLARSFYKHIEKECWDKVYSLTNDMYPKHRLEVINRIKQDLTDNRRIIVSSTQLIEAGVDIDFNELFRQLAPLDAIIQSAGRCNREGKRAGGNVWIFVPEGENIYPGRTYRAQAVHTRDLLKYNLGDIFSTAFFERYYSEVVYLYTKKEDITQLRKDGSFDTVDSNYRLINETSTAVFIIKDAEKLYDRVKDKKFLSRKDFQDLQLYSVHLFDYAIYKNDHNIERLKNGLLVWHGKYSDELGIDAGEEHLEALIF